jgi:hypothetical protein
LPGLIAASVCIMGVSQLIGESGSTRPVPETIPCVAVFSSPKGWPTASTCRPISTPWALPSVALGGRRLRSSGSTTARSEIGSKPTTRAGRISSDSSERTTSAAS